MLPSRWAYLLAFGGVVLAGVLGGIIGYGIADVSSQSDVSHVVGALIGVLIGAGGVGIVAVLVLRAMAEWRRHGPTRTASLHRSTLPDRSNGQREEGELAEGLGELHVGGPAGVLGALAQEVAEPVPRLVELARVAEQRLDLALERRRDVDPARSARACPRGRPRAPGARRGLRRGARGSSAGCPAAGATASSVAHPVTRWSRWLK